MKENKFYTRKKTINGIEYTAQFSGISTAIRAVDSSYIEGTNVTSSEKLGQYILDNIVVDPKGLTADDFETMEDYNAVTTWARDVMYGKFRDEPNTGAVKKESK